MKLNIVTYRFLFLCISAILLLPCIGAMIYSSITTPNHTPVKVSIDYTGGTILQYGINSTVTSDELGTLRKKLSDSGIKEPELQIINVNSNANSDIKSLISIRTPFIEAGSYVDKQITSTVQSEFKNARLDQISSVGPTLGKE